MRQKILYIVICILFLAEMSLTGQTDEDPPSSPVLELVTVNSITGDIVISWTLSTSVDVAGYVVYSFRNNEGFAIDTLYDNTITNYTRTGSPSAYFSESIVVAAIDSSGNISPLSNALNTIFAESIIDTCNKKIEVKWNFYPSFPKQVLSYSILQSVNGASFTEAGQVPSGQKNFTITDFETDINYCFIIRADLAGGAISGSNKTCILARMQRPPEWINADYATVTPDNEILVSFKIDPASEIKKFRLERRTGPSGSFSTIFETSSTSGELIFNDDEADLTEINYYRLSAINNCNNPVTQSNLASNIVLSLDNTIDSVRLSWNTYREWRGSAGEYILFTMTGDELEERLRINPADSTLTLSYASLMFEVTGKELCFMIKAVEVSNPSGVNAESSSLKVCFPVTEIITIPNIFTPDNNGINDLFRPVLSFTPLNYKLIITDLNRRTLFETRDHLLAWDGTRNGDPLPEGVYLWFLELKEPSGNSIAKSGTITIYRNR